jgi:hypothetical protein
MFHDLETLTGSSVIATDGEMGSIRNFLFDDQSWTIRYLVVDVGSWLTAASCGSCDHGGGTARLGEEDLPCPLEQGASAL